MKKVISPPVEQNGTKKYRMEVASIVGPDELWVSVKSSQKVQEIKIGKRVGWQLTDGTVLTLQGLAWNDMLWLGQQYDYTGFHTAIECEHGVPDFETPKGDVRIGYFEDVFRIGWLTFPVEPQKDFSNKPILLTKAKRKAKGE